LADQDQSRYSVKMFSVVSDQGNRMSYCASRYPQIVSRDITLGVQTAFYTGVFFTQLEIVGNDDSRFQPRL
jgi:hypothetical protein